MGINDESLGTSSFLYPEVSDTSTKVPLLSVDKDDLEHFSRCLKLIKQTQVNHLREAILSTVLGFAIFTALKQHGVLSQKTGLKYTFLRQEALINHLSITGSVHEFFFPSRQTIEAIIAVARNTTSGSTLTHHRYQLPELSTVDAISKVIGRDLYHSAVRDLAVLCPLNRTVVSELRKQ
jgi:hypothetical protein